MWHAEKIAAHQAELLTVGQPQAKRGTPRMHLIIWGIAQDTRQHADDSWVTPHKQNAKEHQQIKILRQRVENNQYEMSHTNIL